MILPAAGHLARSRHACVRSLERCARPGPGAVAGHVAVTGPQHAGRPPARSPARPASANRGICKNRAPQCQIRPASSTPWPRRAASACSPPSCRARTPIAAPSPATWPAPPATTASSRGPDPEVGPGYGPSRQPGAHCLDPRGRDGHPPCSPMGNPGPARRSPADAHRGRGRGHHVGGQRPQTAPLRMPSPCPAR
jgi:hypothetical protein